MTGDQRSLVLNNPK